MATFQVVHVGAARNDRNVEVLNAVGIEVKDPKGKAHPLRLIEGYDPYLSVLLVYKGTLGLYRFDRRMVAMSDRAEACGLDQVALVDIVNDCIRNVFSKDSEIVFLKHVVGDITFPIIMETNQYQPVTNMGKGLFNIKCDHNNWYWIEYTHTTKRLMEIMMCHTQRLSLELTTLLGKRLRAKYGKRSHVSYSHLITNKRGFTC